MTRRDFLGALIGGMAVGTAGLYLPSTKVFSFPTTIVCYSSENFVNMLKVTYKKMLVDLLDTEPTLYTYAIKESVPWA